MIAAIFEAVTSSVSNFASSLASAFTAITAMFWDATANSGAGELTPLGLALLITAGVSLVVFAFTTIRKLIHKA